PDGTDPALPRPMVPSCRRCNGAFGKIEERLLRTWGLCLPKGVANRGIADRAIRSVTVDRARGPRDNYYRQRTRTALMASIDFVGVDSPGTFPGMNASNVKWGPTKSGIWVKGAPALPVRADDVRAFTAKLVRGLYFLESSGEPLPRDATILTYICG